MTTRYRLRGRRSAACAGRSSGCGSSSWRRRGRGRAPADAAVRWRLERPRLRERRGQHRAAARVRRPRREQHHRGRPRPVVHEQPAGLREASARVIDEVAATTELEVTSRLGYASTSGEVREGVRRPGRATSIEVLGLGVDDGMARQFLPHLQQDLSARYAPEGLDVSLVGSASFWGEVNALSESGLAHAEMLTLPLILLVLLALYGGVVAALVSLSVGVTSILGSFAVLSVVARQTELSLFVENTATMLGLGVGVDYSLFVIARFKEELAKGRTVDEALAVTMRTSGETVIFSGITIIAAMATLFLVPARRHHLDRARRGHRRGLRDPHLGVAAAGTAADPRPAHQRRPDPVAGAAFGARGRAVARTAVGRRRLASHAVPTRLPRRRPGAHGRGRVAGEGPHDVHARRADRADDLADPAGLRPDAVRVRRRVDVADHRAGDLADAAGLCRGVGGGGPAGGAARRPPVGRPGRLRRPGPEGRLAGRAPGRAATGSPRPAAAGRQGPGRALRLGRRPQGGPRRRVDRPRRGPEHPRPARGDPGGGVERRHTGRHRPGRRRDGRGRGEQHAHLRQPAAGHRRDARRHLPAAAVHVPVGPAAAQGDPHEPALGRGDVRGPRPGVPARVRVVAARRGGPGRHPELHPDPVAGVAVQPQHRLRGVPARVGFARSS